MLRALAFAALVGVASVASAAAAAFSPLRLVPLNYEGKPTMCDYGTGPPFPCDVELTADGRFFDRHHSLVASAELRPDLTLFSPRLKRTVFRLRAEDRTFVGKGPLYDDTPFFQVLFCQLTAEPALDCAHRFDAAAVSADLIWNEKNCGATPDGDRWIAIVSGDQILAHFPSFPDDPPRAVARIIPAPKDDLARRTALYLFALKAVEGETVRHAPSEPE